MPIATAGTTNRSEYFYIVGDASHASPGDPVTGLLFSDIETGGSASYMRQGATRTDLTLVTQTIAGIHTDGGFVEVDATNMPGVYRCDYPDAAYLTGVDFVVCQIVVASANNAVAAPIQVEITDVDLRDAVRAGMTALPNANAEAAGGLYTRGTGAGQVNQTTNGELDSTVVAMAANVLTATAIAADAITAAKIATDAITNDELAASAVDEIWAKVCETNGSRTAQQILSIALAALAGETSAGGATFSDPTGTNTRITATVNASNERTAITLAPSS